MAPEVTRLVLATANPNKVTELAELLAALPRDIEVLEVRYPPAAPAN